MLIEVHMLQNHAPSNLNRDDTGSPKDCIFGGWRRARVSSQCLKRSIRRSPIFAEGLKGVPLGTRTRRLPEQVEKYLLARGLSPEMAAIAAQKATGFGNKDANEQKEFQTAQTMFLSPADIEAIGAVLLAACQKYGTPEDLKKVKAADLQNEAELRGWRPITPDIAMFGRMITSKAIRDVEAAVQVAHAISTHKMEHEFDYFTAVDDLPRSDEEDDAGADMISDVEFNSACYYKYFSLDLDGLIENLAGPAPANANEGYVGSLAEARHIAVATVLAFVKAAVFTTPSGKQNSFAAHQLPDGILVEVRGQKIPVSYANAFVQPAAAAGRTDLVAASLEKFAAHVAGLTRKFSLPATERLWFTTREQQIAGTTACETLDELLAKLADVLERSVADG